MVALTVHVNEAQDTMLVHCAKMTFLGTFIFKIFKTYFIVTILTCYLHMAFNIKPKTVAVCYIGK